MKKADVILDGKKTRRHGAGGRVDGRGKTGGHCQLKPYQSNHCPSGETPHHVVPDHVFREKGASGRRYPHTPAYGEGLTICLEGATKATAKGGGTIQRIRGQIRDYVNKLATHGRVHLRVDSREMRLGLAGHPKGTTTLKQMEHAGAVAVARETGCDEKDIERQLRQYHSRPPYALTGNERVRANPFGRGFDDPPFGIMGRPDRDNVFTR
jgi:hypothetical protein